jgi:hypothetical protein
VAKGSKVERPEGYAPGRVEPVAVFDAPKELAIGGEDIDVAEAGAIGFEWVAFLVENEGDDDVVTLACLSGDRSPENSCECEVG